MPSGEISTATAEGVSKLFAQYHDQDAKVRSGNKCEVGPNDYSAYGKGFFRINSNGGDVAAAMAIGRLFRKEGAWIEVDGVCISAYVLILAGGVQRVVSSSAR
jgi:hypothetical protein